jgi:hypothetical protein
MVMSSEMFPYIWTLLTLGGVYVILKLARFGHREKHLPPGPPTLPIIGNAHLVVDKDLYKRSVHFLSASRRIINQVQIQGLESTVWRSLLT